MTRHVKADPDLGGDRASERVVPARILRRQISGGRCAIRSTATCGSVVEPGPTPLSSAFEEPPDWQAGGARRALQRDRPVEPAGTPVEFAVLRGPRRGVDVGSVRPSGVRADVHNLVEDRSGTLLGVTWRGSVWRLERTPSRGGPAFTWEIVRTYTSGTSSRSGQTSSGRRQGIVDEPGSCGFPLRPPSRSFEWL
jgi:hypothetical protein